ncbi:hypothetical protein SCLCIDRAFT_97619, partial [Scleroderma citrinum Foug A]
NYSIWKIRIRAKLQREKVWGTISGDDPDPSALGSSSDSWKVRNDKALGIIVEYVSNEKLDIIADETIAKAAWEKLERVHQGTNVALVVFFTFTDMLR